MSDKEIRKEIITLFYDKLLDRKPDDAGMEFYVENDFFLETVYSSLKLSEEAEEKRAEKIRLEKEKAADIRLPITLAMFVKDNEDSIAMAIESAKPIVSEILIVDTGSTDKTPEICESLGARVYKIGFDGFDGFGNLRTVTMHLARQPFILMLDSDELILEEDYNLFLDLMDNPDVDAWGLPRKRWLDLEMTTQLEQDVYPDYQYRFIRNETHIYYERRVHEIIAGTDKTCEAPDGPHIHHFQDAFKSGNKLIERNNMYKELQEKDILEGVQHTEKAVQDLDKR